MTDAVHPTVEIWSHRGRVGPTSPLGDNTVEAISQAVRSGADGVEIDTWLSADGVFVLTHDRDTPTGLVDRCPVAELAHLDRLEDLLSVGWRGTLNIELKVPPDASRSEQARLGEALASLLEATLVHDQAGLPAVVVSSFSGGATREVLASGLAVRTGHLCMDTPDRAELDDMADRGYWGVHFLASPRSVDGVDRISAAGLAAVAWTVNDVELAAGLVRRGVEVIISDTPAALQQLVNGAGDHPDSRFNPGPGPRR